MKTTSSTRRLLGFTIPCAVLALLLASAPAGVVTNTNDSGPGSLRQAIADAASGDTITFDASLSGQTIVLSSGQLTVDKDLDIDASALAEGITVDGNDTSRVFWFNEDTVGTLTSLTFKNGRTPTGYRWPEPEADYSGGGIYNRGALTLNNCTLNQNRAELFGGGIYNGGGLTLNGCTLSRNIAFGTGNVSRGYDGGISNIGTLTINDSTITSNEADADGGGIGNGGTLTINDSIISGNTARGGIAGGIYTWGETTISRSILSGNDRGAIASWDGGTLTINQSVLSDNSGYAGGIINGLFGLGFGGKVAVNNSILRGNRGWASVGGGGGLLNYGGEVTISNCVVSDNAGPFSTGGVIKNREGKLTVKNSILSGNSGVGIFTHNGDTTAHNCVFYSNSHGDWGNVGGTFEGTDILTTDPLFVAPDDYRLQPNSPCIDAGTPVEGLIDDIEGTPRPLDGDNNGIARIDIGAYEFINPTADSDADGLTDGDELDTTGTNPTLLNTDGDPRNDYEEWLADTDGADGSEWFRITASSHGSWLAIRFNTSPNRHYTLRRCPDLGAGEWTDVPGMTRIRGWGGPQFLFLPKPASPACFWRVEPGIP